ncbi:hypothetical protein SRABI76_03002 [Microbacterium oxydans]|uniref:Uncharacterized protein n=1 Tax=Microbacterium oxydans TaxID=82380 RepID=A0A0F0LEW1_9MICO|nr:hypothetical protein [Microbacterium oxydans]KJL30091.1 hypothetical protein RS83_01233 [Microbacterium oxydans]CAH0241030.1 hypothetical protein SRABI76_03002 [Microbacterium oxydans]
MRHEQTARRRYLQQAADWFFALWLLLVIASAWLFIGAPLLVALASRLTRLRKSRRKQIWLWGIAAALTLYNLLPLLLFWFGLTFNSVEEHRFTVS